MVKEINLSNINTSKFTFDPKSPDFEEIMVKRSTIFDFPKDRKNWLTYLCVVYDVQSEVRRNNSEYMQRKLIGAEIAGFDRKEKTGHFDKYVEERLLGEDEDFNRAICEIVYFMFNNDYKLLELLVDKFDLAIIEQRTSLKSITDKDRKLLQVMKSDIEELEQKIFSGKETLNLRKSLYEGVDNLKDKLPRKENEMKEFEKNGLELWSPFKGYKPDKLRFVGDKIPE
jgi:hypothetical protein